MRFPPELDLVIACCRWPRGPDRDEAVRARAAVPIDWDFLLAVTRRHRVEGLVHDGLRHAGVSVSPAAAAALATAASGIARANLAFADAALRLHAGLADAGIAHLFVKGVTLDLLAYRTLGLKRASDIDLVVDDAEYASACAMLEGQGYACVSPGPGRSETEMRAWTRFRKHTGWSKGGVAVELHASLVDNPLLLPGLSVHSPSQDVEVAPGRTLPTLQPGALFAYLTVHGAAHAWSRLKWIADLNALLGDTKGVARLHHEAVALGAGRCSAHALLLCARLFDRDFGAPLLAELRRDRVARLLAGNALRSMMRGGAAVELDAQMFATVPIHLAHFLLAPGWRYKMAEASRKFLANGDPVRKKNPVRRVNTWLGERSRAAARRPER